jgi:hypothetical protein
MLLFGNTAGLIEYCATPRLATAYGGGYLAAQRAFGNGSSELSMYNSSITGTISAPEASD